MTQLGATLPLRLKPAFLQDYFARAALRELKVRERDYPDMVKRGELTRDDAEQDIARWRVIEELLRSGSAATTLSWADLEHATQRAFLRLSERYDAAPTDTRLLARRDAVFGIHERISWHRETIERINQGYLDRARAQREAA